MKQSDMKRAPSLAGWFIGAAAGLVAAAVAYVLGDLNFMLSAVIGALVFLAAGLLLGMFWGPQAAAPKPDAAPAELTPAVQAAAMPAAVATAATPAATFVSMPVVDAAPAAKPARVAKPKAAPAAKPARVAEPKAAPAAKASAKPAVSVAVAAKAPRVAKPKKPDGPERLSAPRKGKADDLKEIEGIGPALEKLCNELGFYHFDQIANWSAADVDWVDANMKTFKGRVVRDKWIAQCKIIIAEGLDAFRVRAQTNNY